MKITKFLLFLSKIIYTTIFIFITIKIEKISAEVRDDTIKVMTDQFYFYGGSNIETQFKSQINGSCYDFIEDEDQVLLKHFENNIPPNDLCYNFMYDFTSTITDFQCSKFICKSRGICKYNYIAQFSYCEECENGYGDFCLYDKKDYERTRENIELLYGILYDRLYIKKANYLINSNLDFINYLRLLQIILPFYYTSFKNNKNDIFHKVDFLNKVLFESTNFKNINVSLQENIDACTSFVQFLVNHSIYSYDFNYLKFISIFLKDEDYSNNFPFFGRSSKILDKSNDINLEVGGLYSLDYKTFSRNLNYGTGGLPVYKNSNLPKVVIRAKMNFIMFKNYYQVGDDGAILFRIKYVFGYVFNPRTYYKISGILPNTPIVILRAQSNLNPFEEFDFPLFSENDSLMQYIEFSLPWSIELMKFHIGDFETNCRILKFNEISNEWYPCYNSMIDVTKTNENTIVFLTQEFGVYAVHCNNLLQRKMF